ncbi:MAG: EF-P beta-lysylation protein EpmB [Planctomycetota bacterium]
MVATSHPKWHRAIADAIRDPHELTDLLGLPPTLALESQQAANAFPFLVPRTFVERIRPGKPDDPLLRQVLPRPEETACANGFDTDPLHERQALRAPGLLQKYPGRALLLTGACAMHCRYCFRRHATAPSLAATADWQPALDAIARDPSLREIILSGGDPLSLADESLAEMIARLAAIPHLRRLRIHTRLPVAIPERVTDGLIECLASSRLTPIVVVQVNHAHELTAACPDALRKLVRSGIPVLNQSVLLRGVNDSPSALIALCEGLADLGVLPYYLHQLDPVAGAAHFHVPVGEGKRLVAETRNHLPGYAVPRYVQETPGQAGKTALA